MTPIPLPFNEAARLEALARYQVLDSGAEEVFDAVAQFAAQICKTPIALISLVDQNRQWFKAAHGLAVGETPREDAFCAYTILNTDLMEVEDALTDERFRDNPLVHGAPHIRFYAGMPIVNPDGYALGTVCVIDRVPRQLTYIQRAGLRRLSTLVMALLDYRLARFQAEQESRFAHAVFESMGEGVLVSDADQLIVYVNTAFAALTGYRREEVIGLPLGNFSFGTCSDQSENLVRHAIGATGHWQGQVWDRRKNGEPYLQLLTISTVRNASRQVTHQVRVFNDVTPAHESEKKLDQLANYDQLTGLPNRQTFLDCLDRVVAIGDPGGTRAAVMMVDLDGFKVVNDSLGHDLGDLILKRAAGRLQSCLRPEDTVARLGGDEFAVLIRNLADADEASRVAQRILAVLAEPTEVQAHALVTTASIGISLYPSDGEDALTLVRHADNAMYRAKELGRNGFQFFTEELNRQALERLALQTCLRRALEREEFHLVYQPIVDLTSSRIVGVEALLRWEGSDLGSVSPARFIPVAEASNLIIPLGEWVVAEACRQIAAWEQAGLSGFSVAVNVSPRQFKQRGLPATVRRIVETAGIDPPRLEIEITESAVMEDPAAAVFCLRALRDMGIRIAIDDFGTGYSSLGHLRNFRVDKLKIDRTFIRDLIDAPENTFIVETIIGLGRNMRLEVCAEGVENAAQLSLLRERGCDLGQGYHFSKAVLPDKIVEQFAEQISNTRGQQIDC